jgi:hypothetical protein
MCSRAGELRTSVKLNLNALKALMKRLASLADSIPFTSPIVISQMQKYVVPRGGGPKRRLVVTSTPHVSYEHR